MQMSHHQVKVLVHNPSMQPTASSGTAGGSGMHHDFKSNTFAFSKQFNMSAEPPPPQPPPQPSHPAHQADVFMQQPYQPAPPIGPDGKPMYPDQCRPIPILPRPSDAESLPTSASAPPPLPKTSDNSATVRAKATASTDIVTSEHTVVPPRHDNNTAVSPSPTVSPKASVSPGIALPKTVPSTSPTASTVEVLDVKSSSSRSSSTSSSASSGGSRGGGSVGGSQKTTVTAANGMTYTELQPRRCKSRPDQNRGRRTSPDKRASDSRQQTCSGGQVRYA